MYRKRRPSHFFTINRSWLGGERKYGPTFLKLVSILPNTAEAQTLPFPASLHYIHTTIQLPGCCFFNISMPALAVVSAESTSILWPLKAEGDGEIYPDVIIQTTMTLAVLESPESSSEPAHHARWGSGVLISPCRTGPFPTSRASSATAHP